MLKFFFLTDEQHWNLRQPVNNFHGRKEILQSLQNHLHQPSIVVLTGMGGVGKTQIAAMFAKSNQNEFTKICWINGSNLCKSLAEILFSFGQNLPKDPSIEMLSHLIIRMLCGKDQKVLFVLDDVTDAAREEVNAFKRITQDHLSLLVTSQTSDWESSAVIFIKVPCFEEEEAIKFLQNQLQESTSKDIDILAARLHLFPLAIQQAVCYIKKFKLSVSTYIEQFEACRQSILNVKIDSFSEYDKTLLTVWDMAFDKIKKESKNALLVLGMMAYMDNRFINQKTFLHCPDIDGNIELNEILELLCQYSLVIRRNHDYLEIHGLIQKVVQFHIQNTRFVGDSNPRELLAKILTSISSSVDSHDICYKDNENIWFVHFVKLMEITDCPDFLFRVNVLLLANIFNRRQERQASLRICSKSVPFLIQKYLRTKTFNDFLMLIDVHQMILRLIIIDTSMAKALICFEQEFAKELKISHRSIFFWKIKLVDFFQRNKNFQRSKAIISELFKQLVKKEGFEDVKIEFSRLLPSVEQEIFLKQINESHLESHSSKLKYFSIRYLQYLKNRNFNESEKWLTKFEQECRKNDFSYYQPLFVFRKVWLLYWKSQFNGALKLLEDLDEWNKNFYEFYIFKSLLLFKLGKYDEAESVFDGINDLGILQYLSLSYVKFMKHDFSGAKELLESWKIDNDINNILKCVCLYETKCWNFNQKTGSSPLNQREDIQKSLKECVEIKNVIIEMCNEVFLDKFNFALYLL